MFSKKNSNIQERSTNTSKAALGKFDVLGSYFVSLFYNEFVKSAKSASMLNNSITEAYKNILVSYIEFSRTKEFFTKATYGIFTCLISTTKYTALSYGECNDFMLKEFIPEKIFPSLKEEQKKIILHNILISIVTKYTEIILSKYLSAILNNHDQTENIEIMQDDILELIIDERDKTYARFINPDNSENENIKMLKRKMSSLLNEISFLNNKINSMKELNDKNVNIILKMQKELKKNKQQRIVLNKAQSEPKKEEQKIITNEEVIIEPEIDNIKEEIPIVKEEESDDLINFEF